MTRALVAIALWWLMSCALAQEINEATRAQLEQLNGIGVTMADRILLERERRPFADWDDLERRVKGVRGARAQRLRAQGVTVNGQREPGGGRKDPHDPQGRTR